MLKKKIYDFVVIVIKFTSSLDWKDPLNRVVQDQLVRSATSIAANYVEGCASISPRDFAKFLNYSLRSANETIFWLQLLADVNDGCPAIFIEKAIEIEKIIRASVWSMKKKFSNS